MREKRGRAEDTEGGDIGTYLNQVNDKTNIIKTDYYIILKTVYIFSARY